MSKFKRTLFIHLVGIFKIRYEEHKTEKTEEKKTKNH